MTFVVCSADRAHENCVEAEQKNAKQNNLSWLEGLLTVREYQKFLEEGKLHVYTNRWSFRFPYTLLIFEIPVYIV